MNLLSLFDELVADPDFRNLMITWLYFYTVNVVKPAGTLTQHTLYRTILYIRQSLQSCGVVKPAAPLFNSSAARLLPHRSPKAIRCCLMLSRAAVCKLRVWHPPELTSSWRVRAQTSNINHTPKFTCTILLHSSWLIEIPPNIYISFIITLSLHS